MAPPLVINESQQTLTGRQTTTTVMLSVTEQPLSFTTFTMYVVVLDGVAMGLGHVSQLRRVSGDQEYEVPPDEIS
jgi:hypothetical protein